MFSSPNDPSVLSCKERLSQYSKDDWKIMSKEATHLTEMLGDLVLYNVPIESKLAELAFDETVRHINEWFFITNQRFLFLLSTASAHDKKCSQFFENFHPGLGKYVSKLCLEYIHKVEV